jgi:uncharacterized protein
VLGDLDPAFGSLLIGGTLIGLAAGLLTVLTGRVMSASRMIGSLLGGAEGVAATSIAFIGGSMAAPLIMTRFGFATPVSVEPGWALLVAGGVLIGLGVRFGGASLGGGLTGTARRSGTTAAIWGAIVAGAAVAVYLRGLLSGGGVA